MVRGKQKNAPQGKKSRRTAKPSLSEQQSTRPDTAPRNIILFADGTANSAASPHKTNVWRLFEALDLGPNGGSKPSIRALNAEDYKQLAFYNDGVGTSGWTWWRYLAQGLGLGVSRNVKNMYRQLCRHYQPGDRIYIFGFSRGAYTARVLCDMVSTCGILNREREAPDMPGVSMETHLGFESGVDAAHRAYRRYYWESSWFGPKFANRIWNFVWEKIGGGRTYYTRPVVEKHKGEIPEDRDFFKCFSHTHAGMQGDSEYENEIVTFLGVWDTVASHGISVQEIADLWNLVYPYKFTDYKVSPHVRRARHAVALDDERQSFHPVLIDERGEDPDRIRQVWFAGMHADVGGGYPDDNLAHHPLSWMINEVADPTGTNGLIFRPDAVREIEAKAQPTSPMHDSRRGIACYFRYSPRNISALAHSPFEHGKCLLDRTVVHQSALDRALDAKAEYAPKGMPRDVELCDSKGRIGKPKKGSRYAVLDSDADQRFEFHDRARYHVFWRRVCYFGMLIPTLLLFLMPLFEPSIPGWVPIGGEGGWYVPHAFLSTVFPYGGSIIPGLGLFSFWTDVWAQSAWWTVILVGIAFGFWLWSFRVQHNIQRLAEAGWWRFKGNETNHDGFHPGLFERIAEAILKLCDVNGRTHTVLEISKVLLGIVFVALFLGAVIVPAKRWFSVPGDISYTLCKLDSEEVAPTEVRGGRYIVTADISDPCIRTDFHVRKGEIYRVFVRHGVHRDDKGNELLRLHDPFCARDRPDSPWHDHRLDGYVMKASNRGLVCPLDYFIPRNMTDNGTKRVYLYPWMMLVAQIGEDRLHELMPVNRPEVLFEAQTSGRMSFFVNQNLNEKGMIPGAGFNYRKTTKFYRKLKGRVELVLHKLD